MYCGFCGHHGHNRRTCPELKKIAQQHPDGHYARKFREQKERNKKPRKCSYCKTPGHTKRTCSVLAGDRVVMAKRAKDWRTKFMDRCFERGFGPGTLLKYRDPKILDGKWGQKRLLNSIESNGQYALVVALRWDALDHRNLSRAQNTVTVRFPSGHVRTTLLPIEFSSLLDEYDIPLFEIAGEVDASNLGKTLDHQWLSGYDSVDWHLRI